jgi:hypothetical protein
MKLYMMISIAAASLCVSEIAASQTSLGDQIGSVNQVQQQREAAEQAGRDSAYAAQQAEQQRRDAAQQQAESDRKAQLAREQRQRDEDRAAALALAKKREAAQAAEHAKDKQYQDEVRALQLERQRLLVQAEKARVDRANDFINAEIKHQNTETDLVQSQADANRNISSGEKVLLEKTGEAAVKGTLKK